MGYDRLHTGIMKLAVQKSASRDTGAHYLFELGNLRFTDKTQIKSWICSHICGSKLDMITRTCPHVTTDGASAWVSNNIPLFYVNLLTYPCHNLISFYKSIPGKFCLNSSTGE